MREHERVVFRSLFRIKVKLRGKSGLLGYAGDISSRGMRLVSDESIEPGTRLELELAMRDGEGQTHQASAVLICRWSRENPRTGHQESGMELETLSPSFSALVQRVGAQRKSTEGAAPPLA
jgi:hypothetical protein